MELPDIKEFNKIGYSIAVVVYIHKFMRPFLSTSAASIRYNQSKHNKKVANDIPVVFKEQYNSIVTVHSVPRACLKKAFCKMCVTICGIFCPDEGAVAGYGN